MPQVGVLMLTAPPVVSAACRKGWRAGGEGNSRRQGSTLGAGTGVKATVGGDEGLMEGVVMLTAPPVVSAACMKCIGVLKQQGRQKRKKEIRPEAWVQETHPEARGMGWGRSSSGGQ